MKSRAKQFSQDQCTEYLKKQELRPAILGSGKFKIPNKGIRIVMWNVNGIRSVFNKNAMIRMLEVYKPDFLCINQTKINGEMYDKLKGQLKLTGYHDYWNFCKCSAGYSGVAVYSKWAPKSIFQDLEEVAYSQEGRVLTLEYDLFYLVVVYMPSAGDKELKRLYYKTLKYQVAFQKYILKLKERALSQGRNVIICGDFNTAHEQIDFKKYPYTHKLPSCTPEERDSFTRMLNQGWVDTFRYLHPKDRVYTWWRLEYHHREQNIGRRLDYFLVNKEFIGAVKESKICGEVMGSDHCPIFLRIELEDKSQEQIKPANIEDGEIEINLKGKTSDQKQEEVEVMKIKNLGSDAADKQQEQKKNAENGSNNNSKENEKQLQKSEANQQNKLDDKHEQIKEIVE